MIDPPWKWTNWSPKHNWRSPEAKYPTMTLDQVAQIPVAELLKPGGVAWVWMTWPLIAKQSQIVEHAWRMKIGTGGSWAKRTVNGLLRMGPGFCFRTVCEPYLLAVNGRGCLPRGPALRNMIEDDIALVIDGLAREHSRKPDRAYEIAEQLTPGMKRADIFSRQDRPGWDAWGLESGKYNTLVDKRDSSREPKLKRPPVR